VGWLLPRLAVQAVMIKNYLYGSCSFDCVDTLTAVGVYVSVAPGGCTSVGHAPVGEGVAYSSPALPH
jgi:hypothetical protein